MQNAPPTGSSLRRTTEDIGRSGIDFITDIGAMGMLTAQALRATLKPPYRFRVFLDAMDDVGFGSLFIVLLTGTFAGAVMAMQSIVAFRMFDSEHLVGSAVALTLTRELGPVFTALMVTGRNASAMATTLGTMRVTEQIDAMEVMAVDPVQYLIAPRIIATTLMMPLLTMLFTFVGMTAAWAVSVLWLGVDEGAFFGSIASDLEPSDLTNGVIKAAVFGLTVSAVGCFRGYTAKGGAKGVGEATTNAVVFGSVAIFVLNYFLTAAMFT